MASVVAAAPKAVASIFHNDDDDDERRAEALREERRRKLRAMQLENEREKQPLVTPSGVQQQQQQQQQAEATAPVDEEDPLDAFMRTQVAEQAEKEAQKAAAHAVAWKAQYGDKQVVVSEELDEEKNMNLHCYVCKRWGHTKKDCPHKRCRFCNKEGHVAEDCKEKDSKIAGQFADDKARKRQKQYAAKKAKRREEWEAQLRAKTGIDGFNVLYEILGLPPRKLATREQIRRAYRLQSLRYHPDKVLPEEADEAAEKFLAVKTAYEMLLEGIETGGKGMGGAVASGGDLQYSGWDGGGGGGGTRSAPAAAVAGSGSGGAEASSCSSWPKASSAEEEEPEMMDASAQLEALQARAAAHAAAACGDAEGSNEEDEQGTHAAETAAAHHPRCGTTARDASAPSAGAAAPEGVVWLSNDELGLLLADPQVLAALTRIAEEPCALDEYAADAVVMGVLHSVCATHSIAPQLMPQLPLQNDVPSAAPPHFEARNRTNV
jgi:hypothetical protein